ncbi:hypothetical protein M0805_007463 [Coniferiporia weirii]|nr:hypothetical protein M0805_007463 [Coniferiporia weirii]
MIPAFDTIEGKRIPCLLNRRIDNGRLLLKQRLGSGGYGVVYLATDFFSLRGGDVAVKCLLHDTQHRRAKSARELALHKRASALPGVAKIYHTVEESGLLFIILEFCPDGDLFSAIAETKLFLGRDSLIKSAFLQILDTVIALHRIGIYHRDLKPENVLCAKGGTKMLLTDFGLATESERSFSFGCGSYFYMSPECLAGSYSSAVKAYSSRAADIWALGVLLVNLICSRSPWKAAMLSDPSFLRYTRDCLWIQKMLPLSTPAYRFVNRIFANHGNNISLASLRAQFLKIDTFYMTADELARADKTARLVAREWMPDAPMEDIKREDLMHMTITDNVSDTDLFEDTDGHVIDGRLSSDSLTITPSASSGSEFEFPITPETRPAQPAEGVPNLPAGQNLGGKWLLLPANRKHVYHKNLVAIEEEVTPGQWVL